MFFHSAAALVAALSLTFAQQSSVPNDLSSGFDPSSVTLQVLYSSAAKTSLHGVLDGAPISQKETSQPPSFALGDASEVNPNLVTMILLVDTTSSSNRALHFLQTDFSANEDATSISTNKAPLVPYAAPGTLGEPSGTRKYSWLMFVQPFSFKPSDALRAGEFNVQDFINDNKLQPAVAGLEMVIPISASAASNSAPAAASTLNSSSNLSPSSTTTPASTSALISISIATSTVTSKATVALISPTSTTQRQISSTTTSQPQSPAQQSTISSQPPAESSTVPFVSIPAAATQTDTSTSASTNVDINTISIPSTSSTSTPQSTSSSSSPATTSSATTASSGGVITSSLPPVTLTTFVGGSKTGAAEGSKISLGAGTSVVRTGAGVAVWGMVFGVAAFV